jgi:hypothetical protein
MRKSKAVQKYLLLLFILVLLLACGEPEVAAPAFEDSQIAFETIPVENPAPMGDRKFGIGLTEGKEGFGTAFMAAQQAGIQTVEVSLSWDMIEVAPGEYVDPNGYLTAIGFYGENDVDVILSLAVINTSQRTTPDHLDDLAFDDPQLIEAFNNMADWVIANAAPGVTLSAIAIGNEVDLFLRDDVEWDAYTTFFEATSAHMQTHYPDIEVGVKVTLLESILGPNLERAQRINQFSTVVMVNDYPQNEKFEVLPPETIHEHFQRVVDAFPGREIWMTEVGFQSGSEHCKSSEAMQAAFYHEMFSSWDEQPQIKLVMAVWLHDIPQKQLREYEKYYASSHPAFVEYLSTLGLRNYDHTDKAAWQQVLAETAARGWME